jgi:hypothetical protein
MADCVSYWEAKLVVAGFKMDAWTKSPVNYG